MLAQALKAPDPEFLDAINAASHALGHLRKGELLDVTQDDGLAIIGGQLRKRVVAGASADDRTL